MRNDDWKAWALNIAIGLLLSFATLQITWSREDLKEVKQDMKLLDIRLTNHMLGVSEK